MDRRFQGGKKIIGVGVSGKIGTSDQSGMPQNGILEVIYVLVTKHTMGVDN